MRKEEAMSSKNGTGGDGKAQSEAYREGRLHPSLRNGHTVHDNLKALEDLRMDAEKGMYMFDGAIRLLALQQEESLSTNTCAVCRRPFPSKKVSVQCSRLLQAKRESVSRMRNSEAAALHDNYVAAMSELNGNQHTVTAPNGARLNFYLRTGELSEWRQQKIDCMANMSCFACARSFSHEEFCAFLKRVDHKAAVMEKGLHVHPKFCPVPAGYMANTEADNEGHVSSNGNNHNKHASSELNGHNGVEFIPMDHHPRHSESDHHYHHVESAVHHIPHAPRPLHNGSENHLAHEVIHDNVDEDQSNGSRFHNHNVHFPQRRLNGPIDEQCRNDAEQEEKEEEHGTFSNRINGFLGSKHENGISTESGDHDGTEVTNGETKRLRVSPVTGPCDVAHMRTD